MEQISFADLALRISARPCGYPVRLVAIDGCAGSGKTSFAERLARHLGNAPVIPMDDFNSFDDLTGYWPRVEEQILEPLFKGRSFRYQKRDWVNDMSGRGLDEWREVPFAPVVIFEGVGASRKALGDRLCFSVWIDAPESLRLQRGCERDAGVKDIKAIWERWMLFERDFFGSDKARDRADLKVDAARPYEGDRFAMMEIDR